MRNWFSSPQEGIGSTQNEVRCGEMRRKREEIRNLLEAKNKKTRFGDRMETSEVDKTEKNKGQWEWRSRFSSYLQFYCVKWCKRLHQDTDLSPSDPLQLKPPHVFLPPLLTDPHLLWQVLSLFYTLWCAAAFQLVDRMCWDIWRVSTKRGHCHCCCFIGWNRDKLLPYNAQSFCFNAHFQLSFGQYLNRKSLVNKKRLHSIF